MKKWGHVGLSSVVLSGLVVSTAALLADGPNKPKGKEVTLNGRIVDLHQYMTETWSSTDRAEATRDALNAGQPIALETEEGLIVLGLGKRTEKKYLLNPLAYQEVELKGMMFEKHGMKFVLVETARSLEPMSDEESDEYQEEEYETDE